MTALVQTVSALTFAYAHREASWFNRYNKDSKDLEWAYKEGFYQTRIEELLGLIPHDHLEKIHTLIVQKMEKLPGEAERNRNSEELDRFIHDLQRSTSSPVDS
jgi:hypothetical protein